MDNILEIIHVSKQFPGFLLNDLSITLPKGFIMGLVGQNGAGKTTLIRLILNMLEKDAGEIRVFGQDNIIHEHLIKEKTGVVFDQIFYAEDWTIRDTGNAISVFYENWDHDLFRQLSERFKLPSNKKIESLSRGMKIKLMLACAFSHDARLLILDEPTSGLDPVSRDELLELLQEFIKDGERSVLFSTHITADLEQIADYITFLQEGNMIYTGSMEELLDKYQKIKGRIPDLTWELEQRILGLRKTDLGFEGLVLRRDAAHYNNCILDKVTIDDIVISHSKGRGQS